jgi:hypothetical protein
MMRLNAFDRLDGVGDVGVVDECTIPVDQKHVNDLGPEKEWAKNALLLQEVDQFDLAIFPKISFEPFLREGFEVLDIANVNVPRGTRVHGKCQRWWKWPGVLPPTHFEPAIVQS